ncbi:hypothetical protein ACFLIM_07560 [Nonomuraea sp. M3C6]|uniref:YARHG domain-containing protein n=1 Tax=Nonomuraea marmarensis TaxID=3351344 RepID=A0ABW7A7P4_9ACTN
MAIRPHCRHRRFFTGSFPVRGIRLRRGVVERLATTASIVPISWVALRKGRNMFTPIPRTEATPARPKACHSMKRMTKSTMSGSLSMVLVAALAPAARADFVDDDRCGPRTFFRLDEISPRNFFLPRTRYIDGPGGTMTVSVTREHEVLAFRETENERRNAFTRRKTRVIPPPTTEPQAEPPAEPQAEPPTEPTTGATAEPTTSPTTSPTTEPTTKATAEPATSPTAGATIKPMTKATAEPTTSPTTGATAEPTADPMDELTTDVALDPLTEPMTGPKITTAELIREFRRLGVPHLEERHMVFSGHEYTREISDGMYGNLWYRVFGYRIGWAAWSVLGTCRHVKIDSGLANVPSKVEGWRYWETKHPMYKSRRLSRK